MTPHGPMNAHDVAAMLGVGRNSVYAMAKSGELSSYRIGRKLLFRPDDVQAYLNDVHGGGCDSAGCAPAGDIEAAISPCLPRGGFVISGQGLAADILVERIELLGASASRIQRTSYAGIVELYIGRADAAFVHLYDQRTNSFNVPYVQRLAPGLPVVVFRLVRRVQGFAVAKGNPKRLSSWSALLSDGVRLANRVQGCGSRILLDEKLISMEVDPFAIEGYESVCATALSAVAAVTSGLADVAVVEQGDAADAEGVDFVPLQQEWLDVAVAKTGNGRQLVRLLKGILADGRFREEYGRLTRGGVGSFGSIIYEC